MNQRALTFFRGLLRHRPAEAACRWELTPEKLEMWEGKLLWSDEDRIKLLAFPTADVENMLAEIESGYLSESQ